MELSTQAKIDIISTLLEKVDFEERECVRNYLLGVSSSMNLHSYQVLNCYTKLKYKDLDKYLKMMLYSTYCAWYCYMDDPDFLEDYKEFVDNEKDPKIVARYEVDPIFKLAFNRLKQNIEQIEKFSSLNVPPSGGNI